ncbi:MAG: hypothetical protein O7D94_02935 [Planctomycetota bacterium]|nr:hypothetical protein [Planctomycetota bacterium]
MQVHYKSGSVPPGRLRTNLRCAFLSAAVGCVWITDSLAGQELPDPRGAPTCVIHDEFDQIDQWYHQIYWCEGTWTGPTFPYGMMRVEATNNCLCRVRSSFELDGDFDVFVKGECTWSGVFLDTHVKHWVGLFHAGATANSSLKMQYGYDNANEIFAGDTHYRVDLNAQLGAASDALKSFDLRFSRRGNTIRIYRGFGGSYVQISAHVVENPAAQLFFEMAMVDSTSGGQGYAHYESLTVLDGCGDPCNGFDCTPQPAEACCFSNGGCLALEPTDCAIAGGTSQGSGSDCSVAGCQGVTFCAGDANGDGKLDGADIAPFVNLLLTQPTCP